MPFGDNMEFLAMKLQESLLKLWMVSFNRACHRSQAQTNDGSKYPLYPPATLRLMEKAEAYRQRHLLTADWNTRRLAATPERTLPFQRMAAKHRLDPIEQEIVWILYFKATSSLFREAYESAGLFVSVRESGPLLSIGSLLQLLSVIPAIQLTLWGYFHSRAALRRHKLIFLRGTPDELAGPSIDTQAGLRERVRAELLGPHTAQASPLFSAPAPHIDWGIGDHRTGSRSGVET